MDNGSDTFCVGDTAWINTAISDQNVTVDGCDEENTCIDNVYIDTAVNIIAEFSQ